MASRPGLNRTMVVDAAAEVIDGMGFNQLTLAAVATHLGVRTPSLYNHIDGLEGLRRELSLLGMRELNRRLQRAALGKSGHDAFASMLQSYRTFAKERPGLYESTLRAPTAADVQAQEVAQEIIETVLAVLEPYHLKSDEQIHVVRAFRALGHGFASLEAAGAFGIALPTDESYQRLISAFLRGLDALT